jgi:RNA polymerase sigma-70 factor (ECF subfamily)
MPGSHPRAAEPIGVDPESRAWLRRLRADGAGRAQALGELRELLLRAARFEIQRRSVSMPHLRGDDLEDLAQHSANDALLAILSKLASYRGESRFTTWAYKFALFEAAVKLRRRAWQGRELPRDEEHWRRIADGRSTPAEDVQNAELMRAIAGAIERDLSPNQREILVAIAFDGVPIDVLAERRSTTRGALYKSLHDARRKLRARLAEQGFDLASAGEGEGQSP